jgi:hypothetical protein
VPFQGSENISDSDTASAVVVAIMPADLDRAFESNYCVDTNYEVHNINELDSTALRTMLWQLITDKEKKEIALEHLYTIMSYLKEL